MKKLRRKQKRTFRQLSETFENLRKSSEVIGNLRKSLEILGKNRKFSENMGNLRKNRELSQSAQDDLPVFLIFCDIFGNHRKFVAKCLKLPSSNFESF